MTNLSHPPTLAIIGGTGFTGLEQLEVSRCYPVNTPYGAPSAEIQSGRLFGTALVFLPRHGSEHRIAPHEINYRANIWALKQLGVKQVIAFAAVGYINADLNAADLIIPDQLIDYTSGRQHTFFDGASGQVEHIDFSFPYAGPTRERLIQAAKRARVDILAGGCYAATQGPRLETAAEIDQLARAGADIVGMTGMPEAALAREAALDYACLAIAVNAAAGRGEAISMAGIRHNLQRGAERVSRLLQQLD